MKRFAVVSLALIAMLACLTDTAEAGRRHHRRSRGCCGASYATCGGDYQTPVQKDYQSPVQKGDYVSPSDVPPAPVPAPPAPMPAQPAP